MKVKFYQSIKFRLMMMTLVVCLTMGGSISYYSIHQSRMSYKKMVWDYMSDLALAYGEQVDAVIRELGSDKAFDMDTLEKMLSGAGMEDVASSYVYVVDSNGTMLYHPSRDKIGSSVENSVVKTYVNQYARPR